MEHRYIILREHLDELGYDQPFTIEAVPLVERLLADLVKTTDSLCHYKNVAQCIVEERDQLQFGAEPYKCDNAKLVKECNDLHLAFLQFREQTDKSQKDLKFKILTLQSEKEELNRNINELHNNKTSKTSVQRKTVPSKTSVSKQIVSPTKTLKSNKFIKHSCTSSMVPDDSKLTLEIKKLKMTIIKQNDYQESLKHKLSSREKEIKRLSELLEGGRPLAALNKDCCYKDMNMKLRQFSEDNYHLTQQKTCLETQLSEAVVKQHEAMKKALQLADRNKDLERELRDIDQMALAVEAECNSALKENACKLLAVQEELGTCYSKIESFEREVVELKESKKFLESEFQSIKNERENLQKNLEIALKDKKGLTDRINQFTRIENDLNLEIDRLMQRCTHQKRQISDLENQIAAGKDTIDSQMDTQKRRKSLTSAKKCDTCNKPRKGKITVDASPVRQTLASNKIKNTDETDALLKKLKDERDFFKQECQRMCGEINYNPEVSSAPCPSLIKRKLIDKDDEIAKLAQQIQDLTREKQTLISKLESVKELNNWKEAGAPCMKSLLTRAERERDLAHAEIKRLEEEIEALRIKFKCSVDTNTKERDELQKLMADSESKMRKFEEDRRELVTIKDTRRQTITCLEGEIETLQNKLKTTQAELGHLQILHGQIKTLQEQTDRALTTSQTQLNQIETDYNRAKERIRELESKRDSLDKELSVSKNDISALKSNLTKIDEERDSLLIEVDNKTEKISHLEQECRCKDTKLCQLESNISELKERLSFYNDEATSKEYMLKSSSAELSAIRKELDDAIKSKNLAIAENRRLQNELSKVCMDCQKGRDELARASKEIEELKTQLQQYIYEIKRAEDMISKKETERTDLLNCFKCLSDEATLLENNNQNLTLKTTDVKQQLKNALEQISDLESKVEKLNITNKDYETHISELTRQIACLESRTKQYMSSNNLTEQELKSMKDLCCKLDGQKDALYKELASKEEERHMSDDDFVTTLDEDEILKIIVNINLEKEKERIKVEFDKLKDTLNTQEYSLGSLENLLAASRQETCEQKCINQELQSETQRLKKMVQELQAKLTVTSQQLDVFQEKALDYSQQLKHLRREIANERFRIHAGGDTSNRYPSL